MTKPKNPKVLVAMVGLNPTQRKSIGAGPYTGPRIRHEHEALPITFKESQLNPFPDMSPARPCSNKAVKSKGVSC